MANIIRTTVKLGGTPIIIGGCGRSGTTLLLSILSAHPRIFAVPFETRVFCPSAYSDEPNPHPQIDPGPLYEYLASCTIPQSCQRWCEKTPKNVLFFSQILNFFKNRVHIIHIVRDGRDVVTSVHPQKPDGFWVSPERWIHDVTEGLNYYDNPQVMTVKYEELILNHEKTVSRILHFIGESMCEEVLVWFQNSKIRFNEAWFGELEPLYASSVGRWQQEKYAHQARELLSYPEAKHLLRKLNYI